MVQSSQTNFFFFFLAKADFQRIPAVLKYWWAGVKWANFKHKRWPLCFAAKFNRLPSNSLLCLDQKHLRVLRQVWNTTDLIMSKINSMEFYWNCMGEREFGPVFSRLTEFDLIPSLISLFQLSPKEISSKRPSYIFKKQGEKIRTPKPTHLNLGVL